MSEVPERLEVVPFTEPIEGMHIQKWEINFNGQRPFTMVNAILSNVQINSGAIRSREVMIDSFGQMFLRGKRVVNLIQAEVKNDSDFREFTRLGSSQAYAIEGLSRYTVDIQIDGTRFFLENNSSTTKNVKSKSINHSRNKHGVKLPSTAEMLKVIGR